MMKKKIAKKTDKSYFACDICGITKTQERWIYKSYQYIPDYVPITTKNTCRKCVYREEYGTKTYRKHMKEGSLDKK